MLRILQRYRPQSEDELFDILSLLDASLVSHQPTVMAATLSLFLHLCSGLPPVCLAALERARGPLLAACGSVSREMRFTALCHIQVSHRPSARPFPSSGSCLGSFERCVLGGWVFHPCLPPSEQLLLRSLPGLMGAHYKRFFCGYAEPAYMKQRKMQVSPDGRNFPFISFLTCFVVEISS